MNHLVWVHDAFFSRDDCGNWVAGGLPATLWDRYLVAFEDLTVIGRHRDHQFLTGGEHGEQPRVRYAFVPSIHSPRMLLSNCRIVARTIYKAVGQADAVIARLPSLNGEIAIHAARKEGKPYAVEVVGCGWDAFWNYGTLQGRLMAPRIHWNMRRIILEAPFVIYVTHTFLQKRYPTRGLVAGVSDVELVGWDDGLLARRTRRPQVPLPFVLGTIGYLGNEYKGLRILLKAMAIIGDRRPDVVLRILGPGDDSNWRMLVTKLGLEERVFFDGEVPAGGPVNEWLDGLDLYVHPSLVEGLPRAVIEAMARACPVLGSDVGGIPELLDPGCLHTVGNENELAAHLLRAVEDPSWRRAQAAANFERARHYRKEVLSMQREEFWRTFAGHVRRRHPEGRHPEGQLPQEEAGRGK
jgi:glycosyltransferase involved in cell wall biosynthesis